jgi:glycerophosphoryl diester phosphodiesterase
VHPLLSPSLHPVVGHRGNAAHAPENTLESFRQAVDLGVDALELDVRVTADGVVVVLHDPTLARTTDSTNDEGPVDRLTLAEVKHADAGAGFVARDGSRPWHGRGISIPTLEEVLQSFPRMPLLVDIKAPAAALPTRALIGRYGAAERCIVAAFEDESLVPFRGGPIPLGATRADSIAMLRYALLGLTVRRPRFSVMCLPRRYRGIPVPLRRMAASLQAAGVPVHAWTVDNPALARRLWSRGVRGIISNDPAVILAERERAFGEGG